MKDIAIIKQCLVDHISSTAEWRAEKAKEYPEDERNEYASNEASKLAAYVSNLPNDHKLFTLQANIDDDDIDSFVGERLNSLISRIGFEYGGDPEDIVDSMINAIEGAIAEHVEMMLPS